MVSNIWSNTFTVTTTQMSTQVAKSGESENKSDSVGESVKKRRKGKVPRSGAEDKEHVKFENVRGAKKRRLEEVPRSGAENQVHVEFENVRGAKKRRLEEVSGNGTKYQEHVESEYVQGAKKRRQVVSRNGAEFEGENGFTRVNHSGGGGCVMPVDSSQMVEPITMRLVSMAPPVPQDKPPPVWMATHDWVRPTAH